MTKYALISGGTGGIGTQLCIQLAAEGYTVFAFAPEKFLSDVKDLKNDNIIPYALDITNIDNIKSSVNFIREKTNGGFLDILYNNAGIPYNTPATEFKDELMINLFNTNLIGHILMSKYFCDFVIKTQGTICFTASVSAVVPMAWISLYGASKAALNQYAWGLKV